MIPSVPTHNLDAARAYLRDDEDLAQAIAETSASRLAVLIMALSAAGQIGIDLSQTEERG